MIELVRRLDPARWSVHLACFRARGSWFHRMAGSVDSVAEFPVESFKRFDTLKHLWALTAPPRERPQVYQAPRWPASASGSATAVA